MLRKLYQRLADDRGNLGILMLLTIWALALLVAMVWNTGEFATRRRHVQAAADSAAHSASLWTSRTTNLTTSSNLVMGQNGSAEVILRSITPTRTDIQKRFDNERNRTLTIRDGQRKSEPEQNIPDCEYFEELIGFGAWSGNGRGEQRRKEFNALRPQISRALEVILPLLPPRQAQQLSTEMNTALQQNQFAINWLLDSYIGPVNGNGGTTTPAPGSVTPIGAPVSDWITNQVRPRLEDILATLDVEQSWLDRWVAQTDPALSTTPEQLRQVRFDIHEYQQQIRDLTPAVIREQHEALAEFYKVDTSTSVPQRPFDDGPTPVTAPVAEANSVEGRSHQDSIRQKYPGATERRWGSSSPEIWVDPINVNIEHSAIWHPGHGSPVRGISLAGQTYSGSIGVGGGDWGRIPCAPLNRYINDRVYRDREGLRTEPRAIDQARSDLRGRIYPPPDPPTITVLPATFDEPTEEPPPAGTRPNQIPLPPRQIPQLPLPQELTQPNREAFEMLNEGIRTYNRELRDFINDLRGLEAALVRMHLNLENITDAASQRFADETWLNHVDRNRDLVLRLMGSDKNFMVLPTYKLHNIPDWAVDDMRQDVREHVERIVYSRNITLVTNRLRSQLFQWALNVLAGAAQSVPRSQIVSTARNFANQNAPPAAQAAVRAAAQIIAGDVAAEWVRRPWPYEIAPPDEPVPPTRGISDEERIEHFTSLAATLTKDESNPRTVLGKYFAHDEGPLVAYAQTETFNWMEFSGSYGAADRYDRITFYGHGDMGGSPRPWRLGSPGGWNWEPRLATGDALAPAIFTGTHFRELFEKGGVNANGDTDKSAIERLANH